MHNTRTSAGLMFSDSVSAADMEDGDNRFSLLEGDITKLVGPTRLS